MSGSRSSRATWCVFAAALAIASCAKDERSRSVAVTGAALTEQRIVEVMGDTYIKSGSPNQNQASEPIVRLQSSGKNRSLLFFDTAAIASTVGSEALASARRKH